MLHRASSHEERPSDDQRFARDRAIVEGMDVAGDLLSLLMALSGDHDDVARLGERQRTLDRGAPIGIHLDVHAGSLQHLCDDRHRLLGARVVGCDDDDVGVLDCDTAHERALSPVAVSPRSENDDDSTLSEPTRGSKNGLQRIGSVRVVNEDGERLSLVDGLESPRNAGHVRDPRRDRVLVEVEKKAGGDGAETFSTLNDPRSAVSISIPAARNVLP